VKNTTIDKSHDRCHFGIMVSTLPLFYLSQDVREDKRMIRLCNRSSCLLPAEISTKKHPIIWQETCFEWLLQVTYPFRPFLVHSMTDIQMLYVKLLSFENGQPLTHFKATVSSLIILQTEPERPSLSDNLKISNHIDVMSGAYINGERQKEKSKRFNLSHKSTTWERK